MVHIEPYQNLISYNNNKSSRIYILAIKCIIYQINDGVFPPPFPTTDDFDSSSVN